MLKFETSSEIGPSGCHIKPALLNRASSGRICSMHSNASDLLLDPGREAFMHFAVEISSCKLGSSSQKRRALPETK